MTSMQLLPQAPAYLRRNAQAAECGVHLSLSRMRMRRSTASFTFFVRDFIAMVKRRELEYVKRLVL